MFITGKATVLRKIKVKKGTVLQRIGDVNSKVYQVESGLLRSYSIDEKGKEHIYMFAPENWIIADNCAPDSPCALSIDVIEDAVLIVSEKNEVIANADAHSLVRRLFALQNRITMLMSASVIERYEHFVATYPDIVQRVPQKMIASYLGVTPEALSKAKGDKARST